MNRLSSWEEGSPGDRVKQEEQGEKNDIGVGLDYAS